MENKNISLTAAEWNMMECLWEHSPRTGREAVEFMKSYVGWSRSTTLTMLRRMTEKGYIHCNEDAEVMTYTAAICREDAVVQETQSFVDRVYKGSVSMMLSAFTKKQELSREEIEELYEILRKAEEGSK